MNLFARIALTIAAATVGALMFILLVLLPGGVLISVRLLGSIVCVLFSSLLAVVVSILWGY